MPNTGPPAFDATPEEVAPEPHPGTVPEAHTGQYLAIESDNHESTDESTIVVAPEPRWSDRASD
jgi:hypothetical protein